MDNGATVVCPGCGTSSPIGKKFCAECGTPLPLSCPSCGSPVGAGNKFCAECGTPLAAAPAPPATPPATLAEVVPEVPVLPEDEQRMDRRLVSVLFCDLVGFTPLSEKLDPEEVREVQDAYFALMSAEIERFGGTVEKYAGDAVLAIFGAPVAHGDDAECAIRSALAMHHALVPLAADTLANRGVNLLLRIGINTGEVVSGLREGAGRIDYAVTGDAVNTAARYQTAAEPGGTMVGEMTMRHTRRSIRFGEKQMLVLKGKKEPVPGYPVIGIRERLDDRRDAGKGEPVLIGRADELDLLLRTWTVASASGGRAIEIVAEPGVGKSRLLAEARDQIDAFRPPRTVRARCLSYSSQVSLWLVADLLRDVFGLSEHAVASEIGPAVGPAVNNLLKRTGDEDRAVAVDVFGEALGLPPGGSILVGASAQVRRNGLVQSLRLLLAGLTDERPVLLILEDIHWIDVASREVLSDVLADVSSRRLLVVTARREGAPLFADEPWSQQLYLSPLAADEALSLATAILGGARLSAALQKDIAERSGGNPFFVEELLRELREAEALDERAGVVHLRPGVSEHLPSTLQELLLSRLDRLERAPRTVAQVGSVIGRTFAVPVLAGTIETPQENLTSPLEALTRAEIAMPWSGPEPAYAFKHASLQETAYHTLLKKRRQALNASVARAIIRLYPADEYVDIIAYHFAQTDEHAEAIEWLVRSADRAASVFANDLAIDNYFEARRRQDLIAAPAVDRARVDEKLGRVLRIAARYEEAISVLERAAAACEAAGNLEGERRTVAEIGRAHRSRGTTLEGIERVRGFLAAQNEASPSSGLAALHVALARLYFTLGNYQAEVESATVGAEMSVAVADQHVLVEAEMSRSIGLYHLGHTDEAIASMQASIPLAREISEFEVLANLLNNMAMIHREAGEFAHSMQYREQSVEVNALIGDMAMNAFAVAGLGEVTFIQGDWSRARQYLEEAEARVRSLGSSWYFFLPLALLGQLHAALGEFDVAAASLEEALNTARENGQDIAVRGIIDRLAEMDLLRGNVDRALARYDSVLDISVLDAGDASLTASLPVIAWAYFEKGDATRAAYLARVGIERATAERAIVDLLASERVAGMAAAGSGQEAEAGSHFQRALDLARQIQYPYAEALVLYEWGRACLEFGNGRDGFDLLSKAREISARLGARPYLERAEEALGRVQSVRNTPTNS